MLIGSAAHATMMKTHTTAGAELTSPDATTNRPVDVRPVMHRGPVEAPGSSTPQELESVHERGVAAVPAAAGAFALSPSGRISTTMASLTTASICSLCQ